MTKDKLRIAVAEARGWEGKELSERDPGGAIHRYYAWVRVDNDGDEEERLRLPYYPNSMDACMPLLDEMASVIKNPYIGLSNTPEYSYCKKRATCEIYEHGEDNPLEEENLVTIGDGETFQEAICMAYLEWKGGSDGYKA